MSDYPMFSLASGFFLAPKKNDKTVESFNQSVNKFQSELKFGDLFRSGFGFPKSQFHATRWVMLTSGIKGVSRLAEITISSFYSSSKGYAYPSEQTIADISGLSLSSVQRGVSEMKESGRWFIKRFESLDGKTRSHNRYFLLPPFGYGTYTQTNYEYLTHDSGKGKFELGSELEKNLKELLKSFKGSLKSLDIEKVEKNALYKISPNQWSDFKKLEKSKSVYKNFPTFLLAPGEEYRPKERANKTEKAESDKSELDKHVNPNQLSRIEALWNN